MFASSVKSATLVRGVLGCVPLQILKNQAYYPLRRMHRYCSDSEGVVAFVKVCLPTITNVKNAERALSPSSP